MMAKGKLTKKKRVDTGDNDKGNDAMQRCHITVLISAKFYVLPFFSLTSYNGPKLDSESDHHSR